MGIKKIFFYIIVTLMKDRCYIKNIMLFDLEKDPEEFNDLGGKGTHQEVIEMMYDRLAAWG